MLRELMTEYRRHCEVRSFPVHEIRVKHPRVNVLVTYATSGQFAFCAVKQKSLQWLWRRCRCCFGLSSSHLHFLPAHDRPRDKCNLMWKLTFPQWRFSNAFNTPDFDMSVKHYAVGYTSTLYSKSRQGPLENFTAQKRWSKDHLHGISEHSFAVRRPWRTETGNCMLRKCMSQLV